MLKLQKLKCFCFDLIVTNTSKMANVSRVTIIRYFDRFRKIILLSHKKLFAFTGEVELIQNQKFISSVVY